MKTKQAKAQSSQPPVISAMVATKNLPKTVMALLKQPEIHNVHINRMEANLYDVRTNVELSIMRSCTRCGAGWRQRALELPKKCPACGSPYWNKPKVRFAKIKK